MITVLSMKENLISANNVQKIISYLLTKLNVLHIQLVFLIVQLTWVQEFVLIVKSIISWKIISVMKWLLLLIIVILILNKESVKSVLITISCNKTNVFRLLLLIVPHGKTSTLVRLVWMDMDLSILLITKHWIVSQLARLTAINLKFTLLTNVLSVKLDISQTQLLKMEVVLKWLKPLKIVNFMTLPLLVTNVQQDQP